ncbi:MAG: aminotransferase class I/II-fold pyridoxal phosphate-dependent enzyme [bacterium]
MKPGSRLSLLPPYLFSKPDRRKSDAAKNGTDIIRLSVGDPDMPTPSPIVAAAARALKNPYNHRYPPVRGSRALRRAIAAWHKKKHGIKLDPETEVLVLAGSKEGIAHLPMALTDPGSTVLVPDPCYPPQKMGALLAGNRVADIPLKRENGFLPDFDAIPAGELSKTGLLFLNYPNNPTGAAADGNFYAAAVKLAEKHSFWIAKDAAYSQICFDGTHPSILQTPGAMERAVEFHSFSKTFSMAGWRIGWVCGNAGAIRALSGLKENIDSGVFGAVQDAAVYALENAQRLSVPIITEYARRRKIFSTGLKKLGWDVFDSGATFFLWAAVPPGMTSERCASLLLEKSGVAVLPGSGFGKAGEGYIRFSLTAPCIRLKQALERMSVIKVVSGK